MGYLCKQPVFICSGVLKMERGYANTQETHIIEAIPLRDQIADIIRRMILKNELKGNEPISERYISQMLNVSTTPVKEAFRILQSEGLVYTKPRKGSFVSEVSRDNILQIAFMRSSLEGVAALFAVQNITEEEIGELEEALAVSKELIDRDGDKEELSKSNSHFHAILRNASRNKYLVQLISTMRSIDKTFREVSLSASVEEPGRAHKEHMEILEAVKKRDAKLAEKLMVIHIRRVANFVLEECK